MLWMCPLLGLSVLVMATISLTASLVDQTGKWQHKIAITWARIVLRICLVTVKVVGAEKLEKTQPYVFVCNHFSLIDTPVMFGYMPRDFRIMARHKLWRIPFLGWHLNRAGHIPVNRENPRAAVRNIDNAAKQVAQGKSILIFPEGGRTRQPTMRRFKSGAAHVAIRAGVPIVPMALVGTREILAPNSVHLHPGKAELRVGAPISTVEEVGRTAKRIIEDVQKEVAKLGEMTWSEKSSPSHSSSLD